MEYSNLYLDGRDLYHVSVHMFRWSEGSINERYDDQEQNKHETPPCYRNEYSSAMMGAVGQYIQKKSALSHLLLINELYISNTVIL